MSEQEDSAPGPVEMLTKQLAHVDGSFTHLPPGAVVDAVAALGLSTSADLCLSALDHDIRTGVTTWTWTLLTERHLIDVTAKGRTPTGIWQGVESGRSITYHDEPVVTIDVASLDDVCRLKMTATGSHDSTDYHQRPRQVWEFGFTEGAERTFTIDSRGDTPRSSAVEAICRRLADHI